MTTSQGAVAAQVRRPPVGLARPRSGRVPQFAGIFDVDGIVTPTEQLHAKAWAEALDAIMGELRGVLGQLEARGHIRLTSTFNRATSFRPCTHDDYLRFIDGKARTEGVKSFLASRGIELPVDSQQGVDLNPRFTVHGIAEFKNEAVVAALSSDSFDLRPFPGTIGLIEALIERGFQIAAASSSKNAPASLRKAGVLDLFSEVVSGNDITDPAAQSKPSPFLFVTAADRLGVPPAQAAMFEDAVVGVQAGQAGKFGLVVGVARREENRVPLSEFAHLVVGDLSELTADDIVARLTRGNGDRPRV